MATFHVAARMVGAAVGLSTLMLSTVDGVQLTSNDDAVAVATVFYEKSIRLWNEQGKTDSTPSMYTDDADLINAFGPRWHGRDEITSHTLAVVSASRPTLSYQLVSAKTIAPGIILAIAVGVANVSAGQPNAGRHELSQSALLVKQGTDWNVRFFQSTPVAAR
jgi:uncharacterized protein (TIGR02246 family)